MNNIGRVGLYSYEKACEDISKDWDGKKLCPFRVHLFFLEKGYVTRNKKPSEYAMDKNLFNFIEGHYYLSEIGKEWLGKKLLLYLWEYFLIVDVEEEVV